MHEEFALRFLCICELWLPCGSISVFTTVTLPFLQALVDVLQDGGAPELINLDLRGNTLSDHAQQLLVRCLKPAAAKTGMSCRMSSHVLMGTAGGAG
jgi:hypothetical protein